MLTRYLFRVRCYMADDLCGPVRAWEILPALWHSLWNSADFEDVS